MLFQISDGRRRVQSRTQRHLTIIHPSTHHQIVIGKMVLKLSMASKQMMILKAHQSVIGRGVLESSMHGIYHWKNIPE